MPTNDEIFEKVQSTLVDALGVDEDDVTPDATLFKDLGAESIDLLDIVFRLERNFGIKIPRGELFPENISDPELTHDGKLTTKKLVSSDVVFGGSDGWRPLYTQAGAGDGVGTFKATQVGKLTPNGLTEMKQRMPHADLSGFEANPEVDKLLDRYTVDMLVQYVSGKLSAGAA